jgi:flagellar biosynthetic protein FliO
MSAGLVLSLLLKLAVVLGLAYGASLLLRRINSRSIIRRGGCLHVLETVPLGQGRSLHVVSVGARRLLVASANQQVRLLDDITEDAAGAPEPEPDAPRGQHEDFIARVLQLLQRPKAPSPEAASASPIEYSRPPARSHTVTIRPSAGESRA